MPLVTARPGALVALACAAASLALTAAPVAGAPGRPDLETTRAGLTGSPVEEGSAITVRATTTESAGRRVGATTSRVYLTRDAAGSLSQRRTSTTNPRTAPADVLLAGTLQVPALAARRAKAVTGEVVVPVGTAPGRWTALVCADDRGAVAETSETDNCRAAGPVDVVAAGGSAGLRLQTFADSREWPASEASNLDFVHLFCSSAVPARALTPAAAVAGTEAWLEAQAGPTALDRVATSGLADTADQAQELAGTAVLADSPGLALAALLRARSLEPRNGQHWLNAAALAVSVGLPNEALGLLDGAARLDHGRAALGIDQTALALTTRGEALVLTGRLGPARTLFSAARRQAPLLSEADAGLAVVEECAGHRDLATRYLRMARQRTQQPKDAVEDTTRPETPRPGPVLDLGHGRPTTMRLLPVPETPAQGVALAPWLRTVEQRTASETDALNQRLDELQSRLRDADELVSDAERERRDDLLALAAAADDDPQVRDLQERIGRLSDQMTTVKEEFFGSGTGEAPYTYRTLSETARDTCSARQEDYRTCFDRELAASCRPALQGAHAQWRALYGQARDAQASLVERLSTLRSAYAANLADQDAHDLVLAWVEQDEAAAYFSTYAEAYLFVRAEEIHREDCVDPAEQVPPPADPLAPPGAADDGACPSALQRITYNVELGPAKLKLECEKITWSYKHEVAPLVDLFGDAAYNIRTGKVTFVAGAKIAYKKGPVEAGFKSGIYLSTDGNGGIEDVGWRVGPSVKASDGPMEVSIAKSEIDLSFVAGLRDML